MLFRSVFALLEVKLLNTNSSTTAMKIQMSRVLRKSFKIRYLELPRSGHAACKTVRQYYTRGCFANKYSSRLRAREDFGLRVTTLVNRPRSASM